MCPLRMPPLELSRDHCSFSGLLSHCVTISNQKAEKGWHGRSLHPSEPLFPHLESGPSSSMILSPADEGRLGKGKGPVWGLRGTSENRAASALLNMGSSGGG